MFFYVTLRHVILRRRSGLRRGLAFSPFFYGSTIAFITAFVVYEGSPGLRLQDMPTWLVITLSLGLGGGATILAYLLKPALRIYIENKYQKMKEQKAEIQMDMPKTLKPVLRHPPGPSKITKPVSHAPHVEETTNLQHPVTFYGSTDITSLQPKAVETLQEENPNDNEEEHKPVLLHPTLEDAIYDDQLQIKVRK